MKKSFLFIVLITAIVACKPSSTKSEESTGDTTSAEAVEETTDAAGVYFVNIKDGATLSSPFLLEMGVNGMEVEPKGEPREGFGHHHLLINEGAAPEGTVIVADETHIHYGGGQTSDSVSLAPGEYKLTLQFADGMHVSYGDAWAKSIQVTIE